MVKNKPLKLIPTFDRSRNSRELGPSPESPNGRSPRYQHNTVQQCGAESHPIPGRFLYTQRTTKCLQSLRGQYAGDLSSLRWCGDPGLLHVKGPLCWKSGSLALPPRASQQPRDPKKTCGSGGESSRGRFGHQWWVVSKGTLPAPLPNATTQVGSLMDLCRLNYFWGHRFASKFIVAIEVTK